MTTPFIKRPQLYGHPDDPTFETESAEHALAYAKIYPLRGWLRQRLQDSGRFTTENHLEGALQRDIDLLIEYELLDGTEALTASQTGLRSVPLTATEPPSVA